MYVAAALYSLNDLLNTKGEDRITSISLANGFGDQSLTEHLVN